MPKHEAQDGNSGPPPEKVYQVGKDGSGHVTEKGEDLGEVISAIVTMADTLKNAVANIPDIYEMGSFRIPPEKFDASTRLAFVGAGNALDYAIRLVEDRGRTARIKKLRRQLSDEMRAAGLTGDPQDDEG